MIYFSLEYLFWEVTAILVGTLGPTALATHTVNSIVVFMTFNLGVGFMIALCTRIGNVLPVSVPRAKSICCWGSIFSYGVFASVNLLVYMLDTTIITMFTNDPDVIAGCKRTWLDLMMYNLSVNLYYANSGIATGLGMQWTLGVLTGVFLFGLGMPLIYYFAIFKEGGVEAVWRWIWPPYLIVSAILTLKFYVSDWEQIATFVRIREGMI
jgi:multidrug resistance protein, MATE family